MQLCIKGDIVNLPLLVKLLLYQLKILFKKLANLYENFRNTQYDIYIYI